MTQEISPDDPRLYKRGAYVEHTSGDGAGADVGASVGLGAGVMLFAGDVPGQEGSSLVAYTQEGRIDLCTPVDHQAATEAIFDLSLKLTE